MHYSYALSILVCTNSILFEINHIYMQVKNFPIHVPVFFSFFLFFFVFLSQPILRGFSYFTRNLIFNFKKNADTLNVVSLLYCFAVFVFNFFFFCLDFDCYPLLWIGLSFDRGCSDFPLISFPYNSYSPPRYIKYFFILFIRNAMRALFLFLSFSRPSLSLSSDQNHFCDTLKYDDVLFDVVIVRDSSR